MPDTANLPKAMIIFGASGDLTQRKLLPALHILETQKMLPEEMKILGFARSAMDTQSWKKVAESHLPKDEFSQKLINRLHYVSGNYDDPEGIDQLYKKLIELGEESADNLLYHLALPPQAADSVLRALPQTRLTTRDGRAPASQRALLEKPFGFDLGSARTMNEAVRDVFTESQVYRIDHYLAKDTVRNLLIFRFANAIFEPLWNRNHIDSIHITAAESVTVGERGGYYDGIGVVRDMIQNHVLQILALIAMEPPLAGDNESIRDRKSDVIHSLVTPRPEDFIFGQYRGYRNEAGVDPASTTPTFAAVRAYVNNWRWQGVPFYLSSGKGLSRKLTEVMIKFRTVPLCLLENQESCSALAPNVLRIRIQPREGIELTFNAQKPGIEDLVEPTRLGFHYEELGEVISESYAKVILDGIQQRSALFWRSDTIEDAWRFVAPMLDRPASPNYDIGTEAAELTRQLSPKQ